jgi:ParB family chromosome partitioning protein
VRQTEVLVQADKKPPSLPRRVVEKDADTRDLERDLSRRMGLKVTLKAARNGGTLTIAYRTLDQLDAVIARLRDEGAERRQGSNGVSAENPS